MAPKEVDFYLGTGEVTYPPEVGRRMVYSLLCQGRLLWRSSEKARGRGDFEGEQRGWVTHILLTLGADCVQVLRLLVQVNYLLGLCSSPRRPQMRADMSPSSLEEQFQAR